MRFKDFLQSVKEDANFDQDGRQKITGEYMDWVEAVKAAHPDFAAKLQFKSNVKNDTIEAMVRDVDRIFGIWHGEDEGEGFIFEDTRFRARMINPPKPQIAFLPDAEGYRPKPGPKFGKEDYKYLKDKCRLCKTDRGAHQVGTLACPEGEYDRWKGFTKYSSTDTWTKPMHSRKK